MATYATPDPTIYDLANLQNSQNWAAPALAEINRQRNLAEALAKERRLQEFEREQQLSRFAQERDLQGERLIEERKRLEDLAETKYRHDVELQKQKIDAEGKRLDAAERAKLRVQYQKDFNEVPRDGETDEAFFERMQRKIEGNYAVSERAVSEAEARVQAASEQRDREWLKKREGEAMKSARAELLESKIIRGLAPLDRSIGSHEAAYQRHLAANATTVFPDSASIGRVKSAESALASARKRLGAAEAYMDKAGGNRLRAFEAQRGADSLVSGAAGAIGRYLGVPGLGGGGGGGALGQVLPPRPGAGGGGGGARTSAAPAGTTAAPGPAPGTITENGLRVEGVLPNLIPPVGALAREAGSGINRVVGDPIRAGWAGAFGGDIPMSVLADWFFPPKPRVMPSRGTAISAPDVNRITPSRGAPQPSVNLNPRVGVPLVPMQREVAPQVFSGGVTPTPAVTPWGVSTAQPVPQLPANVPIPFGMSASDLPGSYVNSFRPGADLFPTPPSVGLPTDPRLMNEMFKLQIYGGESPVVPPQSSFGLTNEVAPVRAAPPEGMPDWYYPVRNYISGGY